MDVTDFLLGRSLASPEPVLDFGMWKKAWSSLSSCWDLPMDRALAGGLAADRPAWAFASGYQAAVQCLVRTQGGHPGDAIAAVCITEKDGPHPSAMRTRVEPVPGKPGHWELNGEKTFVSGAQEADVLWVAASSGRTAQGRNLLRMVRIPAHSPGLSISPMPALGIVPEIPHAGISLRSVKVPDTELLQGDGYVEAVKPFRTWEDLHVTAAFLAWVFGIGRRRGWDCGILETLLFLIQGARRLAQEPPLSPALHLSLAGFLEQSARLFTDIDPLWKGEDDPEAFSWKRDRRVLDIAASARRKRRETAWRFYSGT
jgi:hypothetical protein